LVIFACDKTTTTTTTTTSATTTSTTTVAVDSEPVFSGVQNIQHFQGDAFDPLSGITVSDAEDGDLTDSITVTENTVNVNVLGTYSVTLSVTDSADNTVTATYSVEVVVKVLTNQEKAELDIEAISFANGITMPAFGTHGTYFYWTSGTPTVITNRGFVIKPGPGEEAAVVTLTLRAVNGSYITTRTFDVTVDPNPEVVVTSVRSVEFEGTSTEYVVASQASVNLYFVNNGTVPYIDVQTFITMLDGALDSSIISVTPEGEDGLRVSYEVEYEDFDGSIVTEAYWAYIDFTENTFTVNNFNFFENYIASTSSDYGEGLNYVGADYTDGNEVTIPLGHYNFDLTIYEDGGNTYYLMPVAVADLLFCGGVYYDVYYNGDKLWGIDTFSISSSDEADIALQEQIRTSSYNTKTMATDMKWATYHYLALAFDYFYGLKEDHGVATYYNSLYSYAESMITGTDVNLYRKIFDIAYAMDDLHTSHVFPGYYENVYDIGLSISDLGPRSTTFYNGLWAVQDLLDVKYGSYNDIPEYTLLDNDKIAVIHITGFTIDTPDAFKATLDKLPATVESVVIDLSYNTGGNVGAVLRIFGYMTENPIMYHSQNPADGATVTYYIESDYVAYDYNWYILTSSVTFSAANLMTSIAKEQGIATILGQDSSGGASSIGAIYTPSGSCLLISTNNVLSTRVGNETDGYQYISVENGISVDYFMVNVASDTELINIIHSDLAE